MSTLGLPLRFVRELLNLAKNKSTAVAKPTQPSAPSHPPPHLAGGKDGGSKAGKGLEPQWKDGKAWIAGKGKEPGKASQASFDRNFAPANGKGFKGKSGHNDPKVIPPRLGEEKIFIDAWSFDPRFGLNGRLIGAQGRNVKWIQDQTGVSVNLEGAQTAEGLHILLQSEDHDNLARASRLAHQLVQTVVEQHQVWQSHSGDSKWQESYTKKRGGPY